MAKDGSGSSDSLSLSAVERVDAMCNHYETAWRTGERPAIEDYVDDVAVSERLASLRELLLLDLELRRGAGEIPQPEDYHPRFSDNHSLIAEVFAVEKTDGEQPIAIDGGLPSTVSISDPVAPPDLTALASKYVVYEQVGRGMGWVYRATRRHFDMPVAIKVMSRSYSTRRFRREAECIVKVRSPHVVTVHDFEVLPDGTPILVMEWIEGGNLKEAIEARGGCLQEHVALPWMRQTCEGMSAVAAQDIIHRDLKPSNIMIDGQGLAKVADFGLAKEPGLNEISGTGQFLGTPHYMAPEQAEDPRSADTRSDIYSFGACFYHALTGRPPFDGNSTFEILFRHKMEPLVSPKSLNPNTSEPTSQLLERCLAKSPDERFQSFREVLNYIELTPWDQLEDKALAEYVSTYQLHRAEYLLRRREPGVLDEYSFPEGRKLKIVVGDISEQDVEAVVSSDDWVLTKSTGVSKSILQAAGKEILDELRCVPVRPGRAVVTSGGNLKAKRIIHAVVTGQVHDGVFSVSRDLITEAMKSCLYHAESFFVRSIAFPLLGTGAGKVSEEVCLDTMFRFLARNLLRGVTAIREARIVLYPRRELSALSVSTANRPRLEGYEFFDHFRHTSEAVGDFFTYLRMPDGQLAMIVADVAGHGVPAALTVRELSAVAQSYLNDGQPEKAITELNEHLCGLEANRFVTMLLAVLDPRSHRLTILNAGHVPPFWSRVDGHVERIGESQVGLPLGIRSNQHYEPYVLTISPGESIVIVTDRITEVLNSDGKPYDIDRLRKRIAGGVGSEAIGSNIIRDVRQFADGPMFDALCVVCFGRNS